MARRYVFVDEAGNFDFMPKGSRYFTLASITLDSCDIGEALAQLRREVTRPEVELRDGFHASEDRQAIRDEVYRLIAAHDFRIDATIFEKAKVMPHLRKSDLDFYKTAWFFHMKHLLPLIATPEDDLLIVGATITLKKRLRRAQEAIAEVLGTIPGATRFRAAAWSAASEPCLQVADYCCWAIQRKWEWNDDRSYVLIRDKIRSEFDIFRWGTRKYY